MISKTSYGSLIKQWNRESIVKSFGIVIYQGNDLIQTMNSKLNSLFGYDEASLKFVEYFNNKVHVLASHSVNSKGIKKGLSFPLDVAS